ncbi:recombinase family protein [Streptomyces sp. NY05-11A]|uniref:recombinase family protein n=1 Tax=Streptomyces soliscabiei TaxID=588897 RepID=UPI0029BD83BB|nr:recombinase family protein [Streptomyces sp. NY05-11A]MDX2683075.1 recombinase family protein [Streptomyces sp. NY05-11A]
MKLAGEIRSSGVAVTLVVHERKRLGRGIELAMLAEELKASDVGLEFLTGELNGSHGPSGIVFTVLAAMSGMEREYIRDRTLEGHESARRRGKTIGGAGVTDADMLAMALHLRDQEMSLRNIRDAGTLLFTIGGSSVDPLSGTPEFGNIAVAAAALRAYVFKLNQVLAGSGVYAAHVPIFAWIGSGGPPETQADIIAERYWDICTKREGAEHPYDIR